MRVFRLSPGSNRGPVTILGTAVPRFVEGEATPVGPCVSTRSEPLVIPQTHLRKAHGMELAKSFHVMRRHQAGFTLIEMMIVVAIIGILSTLAVFAYQKVTGSTEVETEIAAIFAELRVRQEEYHAEEGLYLSTGLTETDLFPPAAPVGPGDAPIDISGLLSAVDGTGTTPADQWVNLRMRPRKHQLRCAYVSIAGPGGGGAIGSMASGDFGMSAVPESNWYYLLARCDADGDSGTDAFYFARHDHEAVAIKNKGK